jgi:spermidine synthase
MAGREVSTTQASSTTARRLPVFLDTRFYILYTNFMSWLYSTQKLQSEKNGEIKIIKIFGKISAFTVQDIDQHSSYLSELWRKAFKKQTRKDHVRHALVLGLGGAGGINELHKRHPEARVTVIEWDPVMIKLVKENHLLRKPNQVTIIEADATKALDKLGCNFDLATIDLFQGPKVPTAIANPEFIKQIRRILKTDGKIIANFFRQKDLTKIFAEVFPNHKTWNFRLNSCGCFINSLPVPIGYTNYYSSKDFLERELKDTNQKIIAAKNIVGIRRKLGPIYLDYYYCENEPRLEPADKTRIVFWNPLKSTVKPRGWHNSPVRSQNQNGIGVIEPNKEYWKDWSKHAQRHRNNWLNTESKDFSIEEAGLDEFIEAYKKSEIKKSIKELFIPILHRKLKNHGSELKLYAVRRKSNQQIIAGLACLNIPETSTSLHTIAYYLPEVAHTSAGHALIDHWYKEAVLNNIKYLNFGVLRQSGDPLSWRGFTQFKKQFITHIQPEIKPFFGLFWR